jgi:hypothetical protein
MISVEIPSLVFTGSIGSNGVAPRIGHPAVKDDSHDVVLASAWAAVAKRPSYQ